MRRTCLALSLSIFLTLLSALPIAAHAQTEAAAPIVKSAKIIEALSAKDVVLDQPSQSNGRQRSPARDPSINLQVQFGFNSAELTPYGQQQLDELARALANKALIESGFSLAGHTDRVGDYDYNIRLSLDRANAVRYYLQQTHGISQQRLQTIGYGFTRLLDSANPTAPINRRVEVRRILVVTQDGVRPTVRPILLTPSTVPPSAPPSGHGAFVPTPR